MFCFVVALQCMSPFVIAFYALCTFQIPYCISFNRNLILPDSHKMDAENENQTKSSNSSTKGKTTEKRGIYDKIISFVYNVHIK